MANFTETNRKYFDQMATSYQNRFANAIKTLTEQAQQHRLWLSDRWIDTDAGKGQEIKMLEYACGPGAVSMALAPFLTKVIGIDLSDNMIDEYNRNATAVGFSNKVTGYKADLLGESVAAQFSGPEFIDFDVLTVSMALHHFEHPDQALKRLASRVKKGGVCLIIDFVPHTPHAHGHGHGHGHGREGHDFGDASATVMTHGFSREDMQKLFEGAGLGARFEYEILSEPLVFTKEDKTISKTAFIARAQRA
ncbi:hypothetical protein N7510_009248 [Penicillium lagena]|uniref:uncharacterized protein n=1 Tax=Penicillium lagena TaxID=94218 RepID=UPI00253F7381|nr:uncharacterized protein N7510_009248 [Penicillium lagena]KAJ5606467.1 hypothetical protein N7510_009248 [Penicillium lagena]